MKNDREAYRLIGVANIIRDAAAQIDKRGISRGTVILPSGEVDIWGGVAIAVGVAPDRLADDMDEVVEEAPEANRGLLEATWDFLDSALQEDPASWGDRTKLADIVRRLNQIADELEAG